MKNTITVFVLFIVAVFNMNSYAWNPPTLNYPANATMQWTGLTLDWYSVPGSSGYQLQIDTVSSFNSTVLINMDKPYIHSSSSYPDTEQYIDNLYFGKKYYWRVRAYSNQDTSSWVQRAYTTRDYVLLSSPVNNTTNVSTSGTILDWDSHRGIAIYQLYFDTTIAFNSPLLTISNSNYINGSSAASDTEYLTGALLNNQTYYWKVRAINDVDTSQWTVNVFSTGPIITGINLNSLELNENLSLFPVPPKESITIKKTTPFNHSVIKIYNSAGKIMYQNENVEGESLPLDIGAYPKGTYIVLVTEKNRRLIKRFVKH